jgi:hypothetical protein
VTFISELPGHESDDDKDCLTDNDIWMDTEQKSCDSKSDSDPSTEIIADGLDDGDESDPKDLRVDAK